MSEALQNELIQFMFRRREDGDLDMMACLSLWFGKSNETDIEIKQRFGEHVAAALKGGFKEWEETPRGCLALMILVDQFPRNIYRHTVHMYDGDKRARAIVDAGHDWLETLAPEECLFVPCLIMTHQEDIKDQKYCLEFYERLEPRLPSELSVFRLIFLEHLKIISLCDTFPHRDHFYGRQTTAIGKQLMDNPKLRFDLPLMIKNGQVKFGHDPAKLWKITQLAFDLLERIDALAGGDAERPNPSSHTKLSPEEVAVCREIFSIFDADGNGIFGQDEFQAILSQTGRPHNSEQVQSAMECVTGIKGTTCLSFDQFASLLRVQVSTDWEARMHRRFDFFDQDGQGEISIAELKSCIQGLDHLVTGDEIDEMMKACDIDGNGVLSFEEWKAMVPHYVQRRPSHAVASQTVFPTTVGSIEPVVFSDVSFQETQKEPIARVTALPDVVIPQAV